MVHSKVCHAGMTPEEGNSGNWWPFFGVFLGAALVAFFRGVEGLGRVERVDLVERAVRAARVVEGPFEAGAWA